MAAKQVLILYGGRSAEHEIAIVSARFIASALDRTKFEPVLVGIRPDGRWHVQREETLAASGDPKSARIDTTGPAATIDPMPAERIQLRVDGRDPQPIDVVFPVLHGPQGEDGCMQGLLELIGVPYVGSGVTACAVGMDKVLQKQIFERCELPVVPYRYFTKSAWTGRARRDACLQLAMELGLPCFVKPANMGSSLGIRRVTAAADLSEAIEHAFEFDTKVLIEQGLAEPREIECSLLGNDEPECSLPGEIVVTSEDGFYSYDAKYLDANAAKLCVPAELQAAQRSAVQLLALKAFRALGCSGMARVDLFLSGGELFINEVNTIPGFTSISMYPRLWEASGVAAEQLVTKLIELAVERHLERSTLRTMR